MRFFSIITGLFVVLWGVWQVVMILAFSTMVDRSQPVAAQNADQWGMLIRGSPLIGFGVVLILSGLYLIFRRSRP